MEGVQFVEDLRFFEKNNIRDWSGENTYQQFSFMWPTGIKDKCETEIFELDIVRVELGDRVEIGVVTYLPPSFVVNEFPLSLTDSYEVVGNIFEDKDLLNGFDKKVPSEQAIRRNLQKFANDHKLIFEDEGDDGFGRSCVGFVKKSVYIDYNPTSFAESTYIFDFDEKLEPPEGVENAYHTHNRLSVLVYDNDTYEALRQLNVWVTHLQDLDVEVVEFETGVTGFYALLSGTTGYAVVRKKLE